jgi:hypothetical protein
MKACAPAHYGAPSSSLKRTAALGASLARDILHLLGGVGRHMLGPLHGFRRRVTGLVYTLPYGNFDNIVFCGHSIIRIATKLPPLKHYGPEW